MALTDKIKIIENKGANSATDLYLYLLGNPRRTVYDLF